MGASLSRASWRSAAPRPTSGANRGASTVSDDENEPGDGGWPSWWPPNLETLYAAQAKRMSELERRVQATLRDPALSAEEATAAVKAMLAEAGIESPPEAPGAHLTLEADAARLEAAYAQGLVGPTDPTNAIDSYPAPDYGYWLDRSEIDAWRDGLPLLLGHSPEHARRAPYFDRHWRDSNENRHEVRVATLLLERLRVVMQQKGAPFIGFDAESGKLHRLACTPRTIVELGERVRTIGLPEGLRDAAAERALLRPSPADGTGHVPSATGEGLARWMRRRELRYPGELMSVLCGDNPRDARSNLARYSSARWKAANPDLDEMLGHFADAWRGYELVHDHQAPGDVTMRPRNLIAWAIETRQPLPPIVIEAARLAKVPAVIETAEQRHARTRAAQAVLDEAKEALFGPAQRMQAASSVERDEPPLGSMQASGQTDASESSQPERRRTTPNHQEPPAAAIGALRGHLGRVRMKKGTPSLRERIGIAVLTWAWPNGRFETVKWREVADRFGEGGQKLQNSNWEFSESGDGLLSKDCGPIVRCVREVLAEFFPEPGTVV